MGEKIQRTWPAHDIWDGIKQQWSIAKNCNQHPFHPQRELHISTLFVSTWKWLKHSNLTLIVVLTHTIGNGNGVGMFWNQFVATVIRCNCKTSKNKCGSILCKCRKNGLKCTLTCRDCRGMACTNMAEERNIEPKNDVEDYGNVFEKLFKFWRINF